MFLTASTPRQMTVDTVELRSRAEVLKEFDRLPSSSTEDDKDWPGGQFASTSDDKCLDPAVGIGSEMGIGKEAEGESLRFSAACD